MGNRGVNSSILWKPQDELSQGTTQSLAGDGQVLTEANFTGSLRSFYSLPSLCGFQWPLLSAKPKVTEWPRPTQSPLAVLRFFLKCSSTSPAESSVMGPTCRFRWEFTQVLLPSSYFCCVAALAVERKAENCQHSGKPRVGGGRWVVGGGWRGWRDPGLTGCCSRTWANLLCGRHFTENDPQALVRRRARPHLQVRLPRP